MADKNDVNITVRSTDATGPGIDSARKKINDLRGSFEKTAQAAIGFGAGVAAFQGGFLLANTAVELFSGNTEKAGEALRRLPLGIGGAIGAFQDLVKAFNSGDEAAKKARESIDEMYTSLAGRTNGTPDELRKALKLRNEELAKIPASASRSEQVAIAERIEAEFQATKRRIEFERSAEAEIAALRRESRKITSDREKAEQQKQWDEQIELAKRKQAEMITAIRGIALAARFDQAAALNNALAAGVSTLGDADNAAIDRAMEAVRRGSGSSQLASGESQRFTTGLRESAQERMANEAAATRKVNESQLKELQEIRKQLQNAQQPGQQINLDFADFGSIG